MENPKSKIQWKTHQPKPKIKPKLKSKLSPSPSMLSSLPWMTISKRRSTIRWGIKRCRLWLFVKESPKERENTWEILKRKRKCDFVWMDEMRKREMRGKLCVCGLGWEREREREDEMKLIRGEMLYKREDEMKLINK